MKHILILILLCAALSGSVDAKKRTTTRPGLERIPAAAVADTAADPALVDSIVLSGYDKPLRSRSESLFVTNASARRLVSIRIILTYFDLDGREIHQAVIDRGVDLPAGATRQINFSSWDRQMSFVFHASRRSPRSRGIPYTVAATIAGARFD